MDLETYFIQSEISQKEKQMCNIAYMLNLENGTDELICKAEIETQGLGEFLEEKGEKQR